MDNETLASLLRGRNRAGQPVDATANIIGPAMSALGNTIYGAGRGALTAMAGLPGDINQLITDNLGTLVNAQGLPTTKDIQDFLPLKPTTYEGKLAQKLGEFVPVNPTPIAKGAVAIAKPVGKALGKQAYEMTEDMLAKQGMMPNIIPRKQILEKELNKVEPTITVQDRTIPVTLHPVEARQGNKIEYVNTDKFENAFKKDETGYIGKGGTENAIGKRYQGVEEFLKTAPSMRASEVHVRPNGSVVFGDGRHRYAFLRDQGLDKIPISMDADSIKNAKKFGYID